ncbi:MAG TPA: pectate lyase [Opitutaceae bacterium]|nr:pectate lyase [Opitutaceae bacterium]
MTARTLLLAALLGGAPFRPLSAAVVGTNPPAEAVTAGRIAALPASERAAWMDYLARSQRQLEADKAFFAAELKAHGLATPTVPPAGRGGGMTQKHEPGWYGGDEARRIADIMISFQTPGGGWSKNLDMTKRPRQPGELFAGANAAPVTAKADDNDRPHDPVWHYIATFDNDATITQLKFLAHVASATAAAQSGPYRASFLRGLDYIFNSQFPNGGWPQVWPLEGGYHDAITYNDDAMVNVLEVLRAVAGGRDEYAWIPAEIRSRAAVVIERGLHCIVATQIRVDGHLTAWCQQHDALTLAPTSARNYEMRSQTPAESSGIVVFLMEQPHPDAAEVAAVHAAVAWLQKTAMYGWQLKNTGADGRRLVAAPGAGPLWPRYVEIGSDRPLFGDRDKSIHDHMDEISAERRNGYSWYNQTAQAALDLYATWKKSH